MKAARTDGNQGEIVSALRAIGCTVESLHRVGRGVPDLLVGWRGVTTLMEVKHGKGKLRPNQAEWLAEWRGSYAVVWSVDEAIAHMTALTT